MTLADTKYVLNNIPKRCMTEVEKLLVVGRPKNMYEMTVTTLSESSST
jgi:hypothetical protein